MIFSDAFLSNAILTLITFIILYALLAKFVFKPLFGVMEKRRSLIDVSNLETQNLKIQLQNMEKEKGLIIQTAIAEAKVIAEESRLKSLTKAEELIREAKEETQNMISDAKKEIEEEKNKALAMLNTETPDMANMIVDKITKKLLH